MEFEEWKPVYRAILTDFGYARSSDERARDVLAELLQAAGSTTLLSPGRRFGTVAIAGAGPSLEDDLTVARQADQVFAASTAAERLRAHDVAVDCVVTDLDKHPAVVPDLTQEGTPVAVHAHGDNVELLREYVPRCDPAFVVPTTQAEPAGPVVNFGGFTDGDRAAFLADHVGADALVFPGWDFDDDSVSDEKRRKLRWAERLLYWLERRCGASFDVLNGRREGIDTGALPDT